MQSKTCYIFGAGEYGTDTYKSLSLKDGDLIIAADGGLAFLQQQGMTPDVIMGDFDSCKEIPNEPNVLVYPVKKDDTDMRLALKYGLEQGCKVFQLYGGTGGRMDHTLANVQLLAWLSKQDAQGFLHGAGYTLTAITDTTYELIAPNKGARLSVFCYGEQAQGVTIEGCAYNATDATWNNQYPIGVSNAFLEDVAKITVQEGTLLLYWEETV